ncbi:MAG: 4-alpha-glucanotransferase [Peptoniphilaceae bacterium]|nr:4-alpha-glucanotransferase [Peptoniphilaceae bacterium]
MISVRELEEKTQVQLSQVHYERGMGILLPVFSLPSRYGIGTFGEEAYRFVDYLEACGMRYWQILPLGPTSYGDSPYSSFSSFAGNPYFIDLELLAKEGLLSAEELEPVDFGEDSESVDYALLYNNRYRILKRAYQRASKMDRKAQDVFLLRNQSWLTDYALFMAIKQEFMDVSWTEWQDPFKLRDAEALQGFRESHAREIDFQVWMQFVFFKQWHAVKEYANAHGIQIIGDLPIYVAADSADVWSNAEAFQMDEKRNLMEKAGVPPDFYNAEGQLWGNPLYNWKALAENDYDFWISRMRESMLRYDIVRLDHFLGFANYWSVPGQEETARNGAWKKGPGLELFQVLERKLGPLPILVEDLGALTEEVVELRTQAGFPGMRPIQFAFCEENSEYQPHNYSYRTSVYSSTHDSDTLLGWWRDTATIEEKNRVLAYFGLEADQDVIKGILRGLCASVADFCIVSMQDLLELDNSARINRPGYLGNNWRWRMQQDYIRQAQVVKLREMVRRYGR